MFPACLGHDSNVRAFLFPQDTKQSIRSEHKQGHKKTTLLHYLPQIAHVGIFGGNGDEVTVMLELAWSLVKYPPPGVKVVKDPQVWRGRYPEREPKEKKHN